ncbi:MAG: hypothetical protein ABIT01_10990 [Thermoanaerobaculia bacterium]
MNFKKWGSLFSTALLASGGLLAQAPAMQPAPQATTTMEKTEVTKTKGGGMKSTKSKTQTYVGTVKEMEAGKSVKLDMGKKKSKSFDLDDSNVTTTVDPTVAVGTKVKVVEMKDANGAKTMTVSPYMAPAKKTTKKKA